MTACEQCGQSFELQYVCEQCGRRVPAAVAEDIINELMTNFGPTTYLTTNILRHWDRTRIVRFAAHLIGDYFEEWLADCEEKAAT